jgi:cobalt-zinc-cadmium resistance protein CzcA
MLASLIDISIRLRYMMLVLLGVLLVGGVVAARTLPIDAIPDISGIQVSVLTDAPGLSALEVERNVTFPMENALNGVPGMLELRSVSRADISAITIVFADGTDPWFARQLVFERMLQAKNDLPANIPTPQIAPLTTGLGEIYQFVVRSPVHSRKQLRTMLDWEIVPRLRGIPGVIEVNTMGGDLKQFQIVVEPAKLAAFNLTIRELTETLQRSNSVVSGGYLDRGAESFTLRAVGTFAGLDDIGNVVVKTSPGGQPVLVKHVANVRDGAALRHGVITHNGEDEAVTGIIMMLLGSNSRDVIYAVKDRVDEIQASLPPGVVIEPIYDRADFVERTLSTVMTNLVEGALVVFIVLVIFLGSIRGALVCVVGIPASMAIALFGMHWAGVTGDLMSLGAIDFGFLVDGPIVVLETLLASYIGKQLTADERVESYILTIQRVIRPVAFAVAIIMLVYVPLLGLEGVEGRMFRPMATTMAFALLGALIYSVVFLPALLALFVPPLKKDGAGWLRPIGRLYGRSVPFALTMRWPLILAAAVALVISGYIFKEKGANFLPRIDEGDAVVTIRRAPSVNLEEAKRLDLMVQKTLLQFPEVITTLSMTGRAEVAIDPVGKDNNDTFVRLKPKKEWTTAHDLDGLSVAFKDALERDVPSTFFSISQPIEDRTNEMISGSRADVQIMITGTDLLELKQVSENIRDAVRDIEGTGDVRVERVLGMPELTVKPDRARLARYGVHMEDALLAIEAARVGMPLGWVYEGNRRFETRLLVPRAPRSRGARRPAGRDRRRPARPALGGRHDHRSRGPGPDPPREPRPHRPRRGQPAWPRPALVGDRRPEGRRGEDRDALGLRDPVERTVRELRARQQAPRHARPDRPRADLRHAALELRRHPLRGLGVRGRALRPHRRHGRPHPARHGILDPRRRRLHRPRRRRRAQRRGPGDRRPALARRGRRLRQGAHPRLRAHDARGAHHRRRRGPRLPPDGPRHRRRLRGPASARHHRRVRHRRLDPHDHVPAACDPEDHAAARTEGRSRAPGRPGA